MSRNCRAEECPMWDGDTCPCEAFGLDPDDLPTSGTHSITTTLPARGHVHRLHVRQVRLQPGAP